MNNRELADVLRGAASALRHGRHITARRKIKEAHDEVFQPQQLTDMEREAIGYVLDLAFDDQQNYLSTGSPEVDYGPEWPDTARQKRTYFAALAVAVEKLGLPTDRERWQQLADGLKDEAEPESESELSPAETIHEMAQRRGAFPCTRCPQEFEGIIDLIRHIRDAHGPLGLKEAVDLARSWEKENV